MPHILLMAAAFCITSPYPRSPLILTNAIGDSILFSKHFPVDSLHDYSESGQSVLRDSTSAWKVALPNGDTLRLDRNTPNGEYRTGDGRFIRFNSPQKYPRIYEAGTMWKAMSFSLRSTRRIAILMIPESLGPLTNRIRDSLLVARLARSSYPRIQKDGDVCVFAFPNDWYPSAMAQFVFPPKMAYRIAWVSYPAAPVRPPGSWPVGHEDYRDPPNGSVETVGEILVDPGTGRFRVVESRTR